MGVGELGESVQVSASIESTQVSASIESIFDVVYNFRKHDLILSVAKINLPNNFKNMLAQIDCRISKLLESVRRSRMLITEQNFYFVKQNSFVPVELLLHRRNIFTWRFINHCRRNIYPIHT